MLAGNLIQTGGAPTVVNMRTTLTEAYMHRYNIYEADRESGMVIGREYENMESIKDNLHSSLSTTNRYPRTDSYTTEDQQTDCSNTDSDDETGEDLIQGTCSQIECTRLYDSDNDKEDRAPLIPPQNSYHSE